MHTAHKLNTTDIMHSRICVTCACVCTQKNERNSNENKMRPKSVCVDAPRFALAGCPAGTMQLEPNSAKPRGAQGLDIMEADAGGTHSFAHAAPPSSFNELIDYPSAFYLFFLCKTRTVADDQSVFAVVLLNRGSNRFPVHIKVVQKMSN